MRNLATIAAIILATASVYARNVRFYWPSSPNNDGYELVICEIDLNGKETSTNSIDSGTNTSCVFDLRHGKRYKAYLYAYSLVSSEGSNVVKVLSSPVWIYAAIPNPPEVRVIN